MNSFQQIRYLIHIIVLQYRCRFSSVSDRLLFGIRRQELFGEVYRQTYTVHRKGYIADAVSYTHLVPDVKSPKDSPS